MTATSGRRPLITACPGGCMRPITLPKVACTVCYPQLPEPIRDQLERPASADTANDLITARAAARMWLREHVAPARDIAAERAAEARQDRRAARRQAIGLDT